MTIEEFSDGFDVLVSSYKRFKNFDDQEVLDSIEFSEYEKSIFLTTAQEEIITELYRGSTSTPFESSEELRRMLDSLVHQHIYLDSTEEGSTINDKFIHNTYNLPKNCWYIVYEQITTPESSNKCESKKVLSVYPVTHDDYYRVAQNPFKGPNSRRVLRLDVGSLKVELVSILPIGKYLIRYIAKPSPIVLCDLTSQGISIEGINTPTECELSELLHQEILDRAVQLAVASKVTLNKVQK